MLRLRASSSGFRGRRPALLQRVLPAAWPARPLINLSGPSAPSPPRGHDLVGHSRSLDVNTGLAHLSFVTQGMWRRRTVTDNPTSIRSARPLLLIYAYLSHLFEEHRPRDPGVALDPQLVEAGVELNNRTCVFHQGCLSLQDVALRQSLSFDWVKRTPPSQPHTHTLASSGSADGKYAVRVWC